MSYSQLKKQVKQVKKFLNKELIRKLINSWYFSVLFVKKSNKWKIYIDYRILNVVNVKNKNSLFKRQKCFNKFNFVIYLIKFDLTTKYHKVKIVNIDIFKTIFNIRLKKLNT